MSLCPQRNDSIAPARRYYVLALILLTLLAAGLRLYKLGDYPGGFGQDEAVVAYDAWSLLTTGREHHGEWWPMNMRQFGDYCPGATTYLTLPTVALLGPTILATRLICALLNVAAVPFFGLLAARLFRSRSAGLFAAALLAFSPWSIYFSRWATNPCFVTFFQVTALWMLHRLLTGPEGRGRSPGMAVAVGLMLFLWTHEYLSQYLFAPFLIGIGLLLWCRKNWARLLVSGGVYGVCMLAAAVARLRIPAANGRLHQDSILFLKRPLWRFWCNYWDCYDFSFLFSYRPMRPLHQLPGMAHISHHLAPLFVLGLLILAIAVFWPRRLLRALGQPDSAEDADHWRRSALWVTAWLALAPVSNALFVQTMYTSRLTHLLVGVLLVIALACSVVWRLLRRLPAGILQIVPWAFVAAVGLYLGQQTVRTCQALVRANPYLKYYLQYGLPEVMRYLAAQPDVKSVRFDHLHQAYVYHLMFTPVPPDRLDYAEVSPPLASEGRNWKYTKVGQVGTYRFNQTLDPAAVAREAVLRHQVRDADGVWFDLYEKDGDWMVILRAKRPLAPLTGKADASTDDSGTS